MRMFMQAGQGPTDLEFSRWEHAIVGLPIDARGIAATEFARANANAVHEFRYDPESLSVWLDGTSFTAEEPEKAFLRLHDGPILLEATSLGFVEILACCRALLQLGRRAITMIYIEPLEYFRPRRSQLVHRRDYELSDEVHEFNAVPGNAILLLRDRPVRVMVFAGFEGQRLFRLQEKLGRTPSEFNFIFGVPAYHPGWEMNAFANNFRFVSGEQMIGRVHFCGAQNPSSAYEILCDVQSACNGERLLVAPIGTKPHGIGCALYLCEHPEAGVVYDNPVRKKRRSDKVGSWHLFNIEL